MFPRQKREMKLYISQEAKSLVGLRGKNWGPFGSSLASKASQLLKGASVGSFPSEPVAFRGRGEELCETVWLGPPDWSFSKEKNISVSTSGWHWDVILWNSYFCLK